MRPNRFLLPLAALFLLAPASPAAAFDWSTNVIDFEFQPAQQKIAVGDSVTWNFSVEGHTTASVGGQPDSWRSVADGANPAGAQLHARSSTRPGATSTSASSTRTS